MSAYASRREAEDVIRLTIRAGRLADDLSDDPADYYLGRVFRELTYSRGPGYGWGILPEKNHMIMVLRNYRRRDRR